jgi:protease-4
VVQRTSGFGLLMLVVGWLGFLACGTILALLLGLAIVVSIMADDDHLDEKVLSGADNAYKVAIITIDGIIGASEDEGYVKKQIDLVRKDSQVRAIVVRVDSPGGAVSGADYLLHHLKKLKKEKGCPLVVSMGGLAASGGYYVSMAVEHQENVIFAEPTTTTGSIGVIIPHYDISGLLARYDVKDDSIATHERKQMLSMTKPMPEEHRQIIRNYINESFVRFKKIIQEGRAKFAKDAEALDRLATGEVFSAEQALAHGLVDKIGFLEDAVDRAIELAKLDKSEVKVVKYKRPLSMWDDLALIRSRAVRPPTELRLLEEMATPRAQYLFTSLPTAASSRGQ